MTALPEPSVRALPARNKNSQGGVLPTVLNTLTCPRRESAKQTCFSMVSLRCFGSAKKEVCSCPVLWVDTCPH